VQRQKVNDLCVSARHIGVTHVCVFTHSVTRTLAVRICNVVVTYDYSRPQCNLYLYNFNMTRKSFSPTRASRFFLRSKTLIPPSFIVVQLHVQLPYVSPFVSIYIDNEKHYRNVDREKRGGEPR
jgi:hypothetical protein